MATIASPISDADIEEMLSHCQALGAAPPLKRRKLKPRGFKMTYAEIAVELGVSGERVRQIEKRALEKLRLMQ